MILGTDQFVEWVKGTFLKEKVPEREHPGLKQLRKKYTLEEIIQIISKVTGKKRDELITKNSRPIESYVDGEQIKRCMRDVIGGRERVLFEQSGLFGK